MRMMFQAVKALSLCGVLFLAACSSSPTSKDMYQGERKAPTVQKKKDTIDKDRLAAIKAFGLEEEMIPSKLIGLSQQNVKRVLGDPSFIRTDKGVEIWQYRAQDCILDLFLYTNRQDGLKVDHSELRGPMLDSAGELSCFRTIVTGRPS
ncbi:hypothetical protein [Terasakiella pusilla]|uniref:hypothetical protein n=1 Tax=Terasakiella pusilla TaxID=64973 RepID=UPI003AA9BABA